jgi:hypothetical protein
MPVAGPEPLMSGLSVNFSLTVATQADHGNYTWNGDW